MMTSAHPSLEDLLLWQSGELSPERTSELEDHVAACSQCKKDVSETDKLFGDVASINAEATQWQMRRRFDAERRASWFSRLVHPVRRGWIPASASILIVAVFLYTFTDLMPEARADALLAKAAQQEDGTEPNFVKFDTGGVRCFAEAGSVHPHLLFASVLRPCRALSERLEVAGWTYNDLLSAKGFQNWRSKLKRKHDSIHKSATETEIRTSTTDSSVLVATLHLRNSDLRPIAESLELAPVADEPATTIQIANAPSSELAALSTPIAPAVAAIAKFPAAAHPMPAIPPLDLAEAHALLTLHSFGADRNVLMNVQREKDVVKVWGVINGNSQRATILEALHHVPNVTADIRSDAEERQSPQLLPWTSYHGDGPPLAQDQLEGLFPNNPEALQEFVNSLDKKTLELAAEARSRDAIRSLRTRLSATKEATPLHQAAEGLQRQMNAQLLELSRQLQPLTGPIRPRKVVPNYAQAVELYMLVHQVAYMSNSQVPVTLDDALSRIRHLLSIS